MKTGFSKERDNLTYNGANALFSGQKNEYVLK